jgi:hypothetical protein
MLEMKSSISQIKKLVESVSNRVDLIETRIWGLKDKVNVLEQSDEEKGKKGSVYGRCKTSTTPLKNQTYK